MSGVQCGPGNVNMEKTFCMYLFVTWELMLGRCCHWCSVLPLPYARGHKVKIRRESRVEVYHGDEAEPRAACTLQFSSVTQSCPTPCNHMDCSTPGLPAHHQLWSLLKLMSIDSVMPSNHLILFHNLLILPSIFPSIRAFLNESALCIRHLNEVLEF